MRRLLLIALFIVSSFGREYIAVIDFDAIAVSENVAKTLTERLISEMIALEVYQVIERKEMERLLEEQKFQYSGCVELKCAIEIGQMLGAKYIVVGSVSKLGDSFSIDSRMISIETSEAYTSATFVHKGKIDILLTDGILSISKQLCKLEERNTKKVVSKKKEAGYKDSYNTSYLTGRRMFGGGLSIIGQIPQGELKEKGVPSGFGLDLYGLWYPVRALGIGLNAGITQYGSSSRETPFGFYDPLIRTISTTNNHIGYGHIMFRVIPFQWKVRPYFEGLFGLKIFSTTASKKKMNCENNIFSDDDNCEIASSNVTWDYASSYGIGTGLEITLISSRKENIGAIEYPRPNEFKGNLSFFINARYLWGNEATYLKEDSIIYSGGETTPLVATLEKITSKTDLLQISLGLHFDWN